MRVIVQGRLKQRSYETKEGEKRTVYEIDVEEVGPALRSATAKVTKASRGGGGFGGGGGSAAAEDARGPRLGAGSRRPRRPASPTVAPGAAAPPARPTTSPRSDRLLHTPDSRTTRERDPHHGQAADPQAEEEGLPFCKATKITYVDYKDTALLRKFISDRGKIRARRVTGNCTSSTSATSPRRSRTPARWRCCPTRPRLAEGGRDDEADPHPGSDRSRRPRRRRRGQGRLRPQLPRAARPRHPLDQGRREADRVHQRAREVREVRDVEPRARRSRPSSRALTVSSRRAPATPAGCSAR